MNIFYIIQKLLCVIFLNGISSHGAKLKIVPSTKFIVKYVGEELLLSCLVINDEQILDQRDSIFSMKQPHFPVHTLNWIIPTNAQDRVDVEEFDEKVSIQITDLKETDSGNYTCDLRSQLNHTSVAPPKNKAVTLLVLPRGRHQGCGQSSFYCEKSLCIHSRYECDGIKDCSKGNDEDSLHCGNEPCKNKLTCDDGRCLSPKFCCVDSSQSPPNCSITANIRCCRQLIHPALLDQDLHYLASRPPIDANYKHQSLIMISVIAISTCFITFIIIAAFYFRGCQMKLRVTSDTRSSLMNALTRGSSMNSPSATNQYLLQPVFSSVQRNNRTQILPGNPPHRSLFSPQPPPSYNHAIDGPPPPYSSLDRTVPSRHARSPLILHHTIDDLLLNNNNGDINGNSALPLSVSENRNISTDASALEATSSSSSSSSTSHSQ